MKKIYCSEGIENLKALKYHVFDKKLALSVVCDKCDDLFIIYLFVLYFELTNLQIKYSYA